MSASERKKAKRDRKIRIWLAGALTGMAVALFFYAIYHGLNNGMSDKIFLWGIGVVILLFASGYVIGPLTKVKNGARVPQKQQ